MKKTLSLILLTCSSISAAGVIYHIPSLTIETGEPIEIIAILDSDIPVLSAKVLHRTPGDNSFHEIIMQPKADEWASIIPKNFSTIDGLEYYILFEFADGSIVAFPSEDPMNSPQSVKVIPHIEEDVWGSKKESESKSGEILIISPKEDKPILLDEVLVAVSLYNLQSVNVDDITLFLDDEDVTARAVITSDFISHVPDKIEKGVHSVRIELSEGKPPSFRSLAWKFITVESEAAIKRASDELTYSGNVITHFSFNQISDDNLSFGEVKPSFKGGWDWLKFNTRLKLSTRENKFHQPLNRYSLTVSSGKIAKVHLGDFSPFLSPFTIYGKRVRGIGVDINIGFARFQSIKGTISRATQGFLDMDRSYELIDIKTDSTINPVYHLDRIGYTFQRDYTGYKVSFKLFKDYKFGFNVQKVKDRTETVQRAVNDAKISIPDWQDYIPMEGLDAGTYTFKDFQNTLSGVGTLQLGNVDWGGEKPQDNFVAGFDFSLPLSKKRITLETSWAVSLLNRNIWGANKTTSEIDSILGNTFSIDNVIDYESLKGLIVVNEHLTPMTLIDSSLYEINKLTAILTMPSSSLKMKLRMLYYDNLLSIQYTRIGPEFASLGNPYLLTNYKELDISDKIAFFDNKLRIYTGYRYRNNNVLEDAFEPIYSRGLFYVNVSVIPGVKLPKLSMSVQRISQSNDRKALDSLAFSNMDSVVDNRVDHKTNNISFFFDVPIKTEKETIRLNGRINLFGLSDLLSDKRSENYLSPNATSNSFSLGGSVRFSFPLKVFGHVHQQITQLPFGKGTNQILNAELNADYSLWRDKLIASGGIYFLSFSGSNNFKQIGVNLGGTYKMFKSLIMRLDSSMRFGIGSDAYSTLAVNFSANYVF